MMATVILNTNKQNGQSHQGGRIKLPWASPVPSIQTRTPSRSIIYKYTFIQIMKVLRVRHESAGMEACWRSYPSMQLVAYLVL